MSKVSTLIYYNTISSYYMTSNCMYFGTKYKTKHILKTKTSHHRSIMYMTIKISSVMSIVHFTFIFLTLDKFAPEYVTFKNGQ